MTRTLLCAVASAMLLATACSKSSDPTPTNSNTGTTKTLGSFTYGSQQYTVFSRGLSGTSFTILGATSSDTGSLYISFSSSQKVRSGTYQVVGSYSALDTGKVYVSVNPNDKTNANYVATGAAGQTVTVTLNSASDHTLFSTSDGISFSNFTVALSTDNTKQSTLSADLQTTK